MGAGRVANAARWCKKEHRCGELGHCHGPQGGGGGGEIEGGWEGGWGGEGGSVSLVMGGGGGPSMHAAAVLCL